MQYCDIGLPDGEEGGSKEGASPKGKAMERIGSQTEQKQRVSKEASHSSSLVLLGLLASSYHSSDTAVLHNLL